MTEAVRGEAAGQPQKLTVSRRQVTKTAAAGAAGALFLDREREIAEHGVITSSGVFFPLYELHGKGIEPHQIPRDTDVLFRERVYGKHLFSLPPQQVLEGTSIAYERPPLKKRVRTFEDDILDHAAKKHIEIMVGDVTTPQSLTYMPLIDRIPPLLLGSLMLSESTRKNNTLSRRSFFKKAGVGLTGLAMAPLAGNIVGKVGMEAGYRMHNEAIKHLSARIAGLTQHAAPDNLRGFFRDAVMADKLLTVAEDIKETRDRVPRIAFQVEGGHSGIVDFLHAGRDITRQVITMYPDDILRAVVNENNGIDDFSSARLLTLPENYLNLPSEERSARIEERRVTDRALRTMLESDLAV